MFRIKNVRNATVAKQTNLSQNDSPATQVNLTHKPIFQPAGNAKSTKINSKQIKELPTIREIIKKKDN